MAVTITGSGAALASAVGPSLGVAGRTGTVEIRPRHADRTIEPAYGFTGSVLAQTDPYEIQLTSGGAIPGGTQVLASAALLPAGCYHEITWRLDTPDGDVEVITYDAWIGPDGGTCNLTDPAIRIDAGSAPVLAGWPVTPPVVVYTSAGTP